MFADYSLVQLGGAKLLLHHGADLKAKDSMGYTALNLAKNNEEEDILALLKGAANTEGQIVEVKLPRDDDTYS